MPVKLKIGSNNANGSQSFRVRLLRAALIFSLGCLLVFAAIFGFYYYKYQHVVDERLAAGPIFANVAQIYAAPREIRIGQKLTVGYIAQNLRQAGYNANSQLGTFAIRGDDIFVKPGSQSYHSTDGATINTAGGEVQRITAENGAPLRAFTLEPQLITGLSEDKNRTKRRLVTYNDIPKNMVNAVLAIEDRDFFKHGGINYLRTIKCVVVDITSGRKTCGGSTLTQQLAKNLFLSPDKFIKRKMIEALITFQLEARFSKQQIFEIYANQMNLGHQSSYEINGFGEAAETYFGKDLKQLDLAQDAMLAGLLQNPSYRDPYRHPTRIMERRNLVLDSMVETGAITSSEAGHAKAEPLGLVPHNVESGEAPYFIDLVHEQLVQRIGDDDLAHDSLRIYTSLDPELQQAASEAVSAGMVKVDELVRKLRRPKNAPITYPQVALIALDPHTGQILALVGGRNYGASQLNHATANRPTGSIFKPFAYAAAYNTSINGQQLADGTFTALTKLDDDQREFMFDGKPYNPGNMEKGEWPGMVPAYEAIAHSLNIATVGLAEQVGYENVAALGRAAGVSLARATPSVAIGAYAATPIDMAGAYTVFANNGVHLNPWMLDSVRSPNGDIIADFAPEARQVLDPRVAFLTQSMLEGVLNFGTAAAVRAHGFAAPAAGKTGTDHDAWFAGYTSNLLCIIWIGNDDYTDIKLQGAQAAAPIWADFMTRATHLAQYSDTKPFTPPDGVEILRIDKATGQRADDTCPTGNVSVAFLDETAPQGTCSHMVGNPQDLIQHMSVAAPNVTAAPESGTITNAPPHTTPNSPAPGVPAQEATTPPPANPNGTPAEPKKRNIFQKIFGTGKNKQPPPPSPPPQ